MITPLAGVHVALLQTNASTAPLSMAEKKIVSRAHLDAFLHSQTYKDVVEFIEALNEASIGITLRAGVYESEVSLEN